MEGRWLSVDEIAGYLGISRDTVYAWLTDKGLPGHYSATRGSSSEGSLTLRYVRTALNRRRTPMGTKGGTSHDHDQEGLDRHTVLLVDDEPGILDNLRELLETDGHYVFTAGSGEQALEMLETATPCLVLSDVNMPGMDGVETLEALLVRAEKTALSGHMAG